MPFIRDGLIGSLLGGVDQLERRASDDGPAFVRDGAGDTSADCCPRSHR